MATYLYCVLRRANAEPVPRDLRGLAGEPVRAVSDVTVGTLEAWVGTVGQDELRASGATLARLALRHNDVVNAAMGTGRTPVPARFGSQFADDAACLKEIIAHAPNLLETLDRVAGAIEVPVLLVPNTRPWRTKARPSRGEAGAGRKYLEAVRARAREEEQRRVLVTKEADRVSALVGSLVRAEARSIDSHGIFALAHLVSRETFDRYRTALAEYHPESGVKIVVGDVRAPYSFAEVKGPGTGHDSGSPNRSD